MRGQTKSGGFTQNPALSYPVYLSLEDASATLNTGPSFDDALPEFYAAWAEGPHIVVFPDGRQVAVSIGSVTVGAAELAGLVGVWTGSAWADKPAKVWTGSAWMQKPVKHWSGTAWV